MLGSPFDCDICGDQGMSAYAVTFFDFTKAELCEDCLKREERDNRVLLSQKFVGVD